MTNCYAVEGMPREVHVIYLSPIPYTSALTMQECLASRRLSDTVPDTLLLLEHDPVFTAGRTSQLSDYPVDSESSVGRPIQIVRVNRGGSVTYHGPGQIVGYPVLRLKDHCAGPKSYVHLLEETLIRTLADWEIIGGRRDRLPGVWVGSECPMKIASIGVRISQGIATHGFALNVDMDLAPFQRIVPCGISGCKVTSMAAVLGNSVEVARVMLSLAGHFADVFGVALIAGNDLSDSTFGLPVSILDRCLGKVRITGEGMERGRL